MLKQEEQSDTGSNEDQHCLVCNASINQKEEVLHSIFSKLELPNNSSNTSIFCAIGQILDRSLSSINMHSDVICHDCFLLLTEYTSVESKLSSIRSHFTKTFDGTATEHNSISEHGTQGAACNVKRKGLSKKVKRIINEEGKLIIIVDESEADNDTDPDAKKSTYKEIRKKRARKGTVSRPFACPVCRKEFRAYSHRVEHMLIHLGEKPWLCNECNKSFRTKNALRVHSMVHSGQKPFSCKECGKTFTEKCHLEEHSRIHSGEKPFICHICGRNFTRKKDLTVHLKIHTDDKPYMCMQCPKTFAVKSRLERHLKIHSGEKPFNCEYCSRSFARKDDFKVHARQHTGERPFQCSYCEKTFANHSNRLAHMRTHTGNKKYVCTLCSKAFVRRSKLEEHYNTTHNNEDCKGAPIESSPVKSAPIDGSGARNTVIQPTENVQLPFEEPMAFVTSVADLQVLQPVPMDQASQVLWSETLPSANATYLYSVPTTIINLVG